MDSYQAPDQVHDDGQILGKYPIRARFRFRFSVKDQFLTDQPHELRIIIN